MKQKVNNFLIVMLALTAMGASLAYKFMPNVAPVDDLNLFEARFAEIIPKVSPSVVAIKVEKPTEMVNMTDQSSGSGFIIDSEGFIVTNYHVIEDAANIRVTLNNKETYFAQLIGKDDRKDIAILKIQAPDLQSVTLGDIDELAPGQAVIVMGNPLGLAADGKPVSTFGRINKLNQILDTGTPGNTKRFYDNMIQTDAITVPGNSGGPLINQFGQVIGINTAMAQGVKTNQQFGFAITFDTDTRELVWELAQGIEPEHGFMGISMAESIDPLISQQLKLKDISGALIAYVVEDSPAAKAQLKMGDFIQYLDGKKIHDNNDLSSYIDNQRPGKTVTVEFLRQNPYTLEVQNMTTKITLASRQNLQMPKPFTKPNK
ncbi:MAG: trypsin-like peptidase domain-containing protein [Phycisphaerae bacterium]|nr:trypsin-like peptidase domain-containing protein [Phycisphaerae bacterium]